MRIQRIDHRIGRPVNRVQRFLSRRKIHVKFVEPSFVHLNAVAEHMIQLMDESRTQIERWQIGIDQNLSFNAVITSRHQKFAFALSFLIPNLRAFLSAPKRSQKLNDVTPPARLMIQKCGSE